MTKNSLALSLKRLAIAVKTAWYERKPENIFLLIAIPATLLFLIAIPPLQGWDEAAHFLRAYQVSEMNAVADDLGNHHTGGQLPEDIVKMHDSALSDLVRSAQSNLKEKVNPKAFAWAIKDFSPSRNTVAKRFEASAMYSPVSYAPQAAGIITARILHAPLLSYIYFGRLFNAVFYIMVVYFALKITSRGKWAFVAIALLPTSLTAAATLSPDVLINSCSLLILAVFIRGIFTKKPLSRQILFAGLFSAIVLATTKQTYFVLCLLPCLLPPKRSYGGLRRYLIWAALIVGVSFCAMMFWNLGVRNIVEYSYLAFKPDQNISPTRQLSHIISSPVGYIGLVVWQVLAKANRLYVEFAGQVTWKGIVLPYVIIFLTYSGLVTSFLLARYEKGQVYVEKKFNKLIVTLGPLAILMIGTILIYTALYLTFNEVGSSSIEGVQGRYFIPIIGLTLPSIIIFGRVNNRSNLFNDEKIKKIITGIFVIQTLAALIVVAATNYLPGVKFI